ncbi:hypothetical protein FHS46_001739 [Variibacter gotjawalensis]|nr:hypothetical protein [Variibacter gotjawalensis]
MDGPHEVGHDEARRKSKAVMAEKTKEITVGLPL